MSIEHTVIAVKEYAYSEQSKLMHSMCSQLIADYHEQLESARGERIVELQSAIKQLRGIQGVLIAKPHSDPRI